MHPATVSLFSFNKCLFGIPDIEELIEFSKNIHGKCLYDFYSFKFVTIIRMEFVEFQPFSKGARKRLFSLVTKTLKLVDLYILGKTLEVSPLEQLMKLKKIACIVPPLFAHKIYRIYDNTSWGFPEYIRAKCLFNISLLNFLLGFRGLWLLWAALLGPFSCRPLRI